MGMYFSATQLAFYDEAVHGHRQLEQPRTKKEIKAKKRPMMIDNPDCKIPEDAVPVTDEEYADIRALLDSGLMLAAKSGKPAAVAQYRDAAETEASNRRVRDRLLAASDWTQLVDAPIDEALRGPWQTYRQQLRDLDMTNPAWPAAPGTEEAGA